MNLNAFFAALLLASVFLCSVDSWRRRRRRRCYRNCTPGSWSSWTSCTRACGTGTQYRTRGIAVHAQCGGSCNHALKETRYCNTYCCRVNCAWSWNAWSPCKGCGTSTQTRTMRITRNPSCGGTTCPSTRSQTRNCNTGVSCPDCTITWTAWSSCSWPCGYSGIKTRRRIIINPATNGGSCPFPANQTQACNMEAWRCQHGGERTFRGCNCTVGWSGTCCEYATTFITGNVTAGKPYSDSTCVCKEGMSSPAPTSVMRTLTTSLPAAYPSTSAPTSVLRTWTTSLLAAYPSTSASTSRILTSNTSLPAVSPSTSATTFVTTNVTAGNSYSQDSTCVCEEKMSSPASPYIITTAKIPPTTFSSAKPSSPTINATTIEPIRGIYFKHISSTLACSNLGKNVGIPVEECPSELLSSHCARLLSHVDTSQGLVLGKRRQQTVYLSIGVVSTEGEDENLLPALYSLKSHLSPTEHSNVVIVVAFEGGSQAAILQNIEKDFQNELDSGLLQVIYPTNAFLMEVSVEPQEWGPLSFTEDFKKKTADYNKRLVFLFEYCFRMSKNFLLLTDQARAVKPYYSVIKQQIDNFEKLNLSSYAHNFGANGLAGLGRLYSAKLASHFAEFGSMFPDGHPPSKIVDMYTFLRDTVKVSSQRREEVLFNIGKEPRDVKLEVEFNTTCSFQVFHELEKAFDKDGFAWLKTAKKDDNLVMVFKEPIQISRVRIATGSPLYRDTLSDSVLMACENNIETGSCDDLKCTEVGDFRDPVLDVKTLSNLTSFPVKCLKIVFTADVKHWVIIREISVWPKVQRKEQSLYM